MKAAVLYEPGAPANFILEDRDKPKPRKSEVLVRVRAFGLNRSELMTRKGLSPSVQFPRVLGIECVGEVEFDPSRRLKKGQKVLALMGGMGRSFDGSYSEFVTVPRNILHPFESNLSWDILGAIPEMFQTVYGSLFNALQIQSGQYILVRGGTSSVGILAIQMAKKHGLKVIATSRKVERKPFLLDLGADHMLVDNGNISTQIADIIPSGVDKVLELVGTSTLHDSLRSVCPGGTVCMTGILSENWLIESLAPMEFIPSCVNLTIYDSGASTISTRDFQEFIQETERNNYHLKIGGVFKLDQIVKAHELMESNRAEGKIVVTI